MPAQVAFNTPLVSNDQSFDRVLNAGLPVAALFSARGPDGEPETEMNAIARAEAGQLLVVKIRTDENPELTRRYSVHSTPVLITFRNGKELKRAENPTAQSFRAHVAFLLGRGPEPTSPAPPPPPQQRTAQAGQDGRPLTITDQSFQRDVLESPLPVVVDFWAPWCGPCRMVSPIVERLSNEFAGKLRVGKMNVDENPYTSQRYQVQGIPTLLFVKDGKIVNRVVGAAPERQIRQAVEQFLKL